MGALAAIKDELPALVFTFNGTHLSIATYMVDIHLAMGMENKTEMQRKICAAHRAAAYGSDGDDGCDDVPRRKAKKTKSSESTSSKSSEDKDSDNSSGESSVDDIDWSALSTSLR